MVNKAEFRALRYDLIENDCAHCDHGGRRARDHDSDHDPPPVVVHWQLAIIEKNKDFLTNNWNSQACERDLLLEQTQESHLLQLQ